MIWGTKRVGSGGGVRAEGAHRLGRGGRADRAQRPWPGEGNTAETTTIVPMITGFLDRHELADAPMVVAADAGMLSAANLKALDELGSRSSSARASPRPRGSGIPFPLARRRFHRRTDHRHRHTSARQHQRQQHRTSAPNQSGTPSSIPERGGRSGRTRPNEPAATRRHWPPKKPAPEPSSPARRRPSQPGSSRSAATTAPSTRPAWPAHNPWSGSRATSPTYPSR